MNVRACQHPTCAEYVTAGRYCPQHAAGAADARKLRLAHYDKHHRNKVAKRFYNSAAWARARELRLTANPVCEHCRRALAEHVHHRKPLAECSPRETLDQDNLMAVCPRCHGEIEQKLRHR